MRPAYGLSAVLPQAFTAPLPGCESLGPRIGSKEVLMLGIGLSCFLVLFAFGGKFLGWNDPTGQVQLGLFMSFLFGIVCGYRTRS